MIALSLLGPCWVALARLPSSLETLTFGEDPGHQSMERNGNDGPGNIPKVW